MPTVVTPTSLLQLTPLTPPAWTEEVSTDGDLIECSRTLGVVPGGSDALGTVTVSLVRRDEVGATREHIDVVRHPATVLVGGVSLTPADTGELAKLLTDATALVRPEAVPARVADPTRAN